MDVSHFNSLWELMSEHTFAINHDSINDDFECILCHKLLIDACKTPCNCRFCYKCICDYLDNENKYCPGIKPECKQEYLIPPIDLFRDSNINLKILNLEVDCPNASCRSLIRLSKMEEHLGVCQIQSNSNAVSKEAAILDNINTEIYTHFDSIMNNMKNEFGTFKETLEVYRLENEFLKDELRIRDIKLDEIEGIKADLVVKEDRIIELETKLCEIGSDIRVQPSEIANMKVQLRNKEHRIVVLENKIDRLHRELTSEKNKRELNVSLLEENLETRITILEDNLSDMSRKNESMERKMIYYTTWRSLCPNVDVDFVWRVNYLSQYKRQNVFSDSFYYNDYKLCLCYKLSADNIALWCHIQKGDYDDNLDWPMAYRVTLNLVNQDTMMPVKSESYQYNSYYPKFKWVFTQPKNDRNKCGIGSSTFIRYSLISDDTSIVIHDSIIVSCELSRDDFDDCSSTE